MPHGEGTDGGQKAQAWAEVLVRMGAQGFQELNESSEVRCTGWDRDVMGSSSQRAQNCAHSAGNSSHTGQEGAIRGPTLEVRPSRPWSFR